MAFTAGDVEKWLGVTVGSLDAGTLTRIIAAVTDHAEQHYTEADVAADRWDQALIMQSARLYQRKRSPDGLAAGNDDTGPVRVLAFDADVQRLLSPGLIVVGLFGPTEV